jgi:hypothetical protein
LSLQLQNLVYEQRHLRGEISACEGYECVSSYLLGLNTDAAQPQVPKPPAGPRRGVSGDVPGQGRVGGARVDDRAHRA